MLDIEEKNKKKINRVCLANKDDPVDIYTEVTRVEGTKAHINVVWNLKNKSSQNKWNPDMQLVPVLSYPTLRIKPESNICELIQDEVGQLNVRVRLPENYKANHLILMFKLKDGKRHVGPNLLLCAKIINRKVVEEEVSAFAMENDLENVRSQGGLQNQLKMIKRGIDVYTE